MTSVAGWLREVHRYATCGVIVMSHINLAGKWVSSCHDLDHADDAEADAVRWSDAGHNVYYRVHLLDKPMPFYKRGSAAETATVTHFAADVDVAGPGHKPPLGCVLPSRVEALALIDATLRPSALISSGGGFYPIYRLTEPADVTDPAVRARVCELGARLDAGLGAHGFHVDKTVADLGRVIRPAGVLNQKPGRDVRPVEVLRWFDGPDYGLDDLDDQLPALPVPVSRVTVPPRRTQRRTLDPFGARTGSRPPIWEIFNDRETIDTVLAEDSRTWTETAPSGPIRHFRDANAHNDASLKHDTRTGLSWVPSSRLASELGIAPLSQGMDLYGLACRLSGLDPADVARGAA